jgi:ribosomal protein L37E
MSAEEKNKRMKELKIKILNKYYAICPKCGRRTWNIKTASCDSCFDSFEFV